MAAKGAQKSAKELIKINEITNVQNPVADFRNIFAAMPAKNLSCIYQLKTMKLVQNWNFWIGMYAMALSGTCPRIHLDLHHKRVGDAPPICDLRTSVFFMTCHSAQKWIQQINQAKLRFPSKVLCSWRKIFML